MLLARIYERISFGIWRWQIRLAMHGEADVATGYGFLHTAPFRTFQMLVATTSSIRRLSGSPTGVALFRGSVRRSWLVLVATTSVLRPHDCDCTDGIINMS